VLARADVPESVIPEIADFPQARFFEFGWGDAEFYPARVAGAWLAFVAAWERITVMATVDSSRRRLTSRHRQLFGEAFARSWSGSPAAETGFSGH
jgi:hypothetical protein